MTESKRESPDNLAFYCPDHSPAPEPYEGDLADLVGKHVYLRFTDPEQREVTAELMWVQVTHIKDGMVCGILDNEPFYMTNIRLADPVRCTREEIRKAD